MTINATASDWLESRGIDVELAAKLGLESCKFPGTGNEAIRLPYVVGDSVVNHKYRQLQTKDHRQDKDATKCFWNYNALVDPALANEPLIITEGEWDAIIAMQCGYARVVSVPDGAPAQSVESEESRKYSYLEHAKSALRDVKEIIIASDEDEAGINLLTDLSVRIGKAKCKWLRYPKGCKDLNEAFLKYGERGVHETIRRAEWCKVDGIYRMSELPPYNDRQGHTTGMGFLDPHYRVRMGDFCVITGIPGYGKTTFANDLACRMATKHGWTIAICSPEQHPQSDHRRALREWYCGRPACYIPPDSLREADEWIDRHFVFIVPGDDDLPTLEWTLDKCAAAVIRYGARVVIIDPWNELDHDRPRDMSLTEYTGRAIKEFKLLARKLDVHVQIIAHPTKLGGGEMPSLYSISDSAHWANKADIGIVIHRDSPDETLTQIIVKKSRYHDQIGRPGTVWAHYDTATRRFMEAPNPKEMAA